MTEQTISSQALLSSAWEDEDKHLRSRAPLDLEPPRTTFTVLLPARHGSRAQISERRLPGIRRLIRNRSMSAFEIALAVRSILLFSNCAALRRNTSVQHDGT